MRHRLLLAAGLLLAGCYKSGGGTPATTPPSNAVHGVTVDYSATLADPLGFLPVDSEVVVSIDAEQIRGSEIWRMLEPKLWQTAGTSLAAFKAACGFDPVATVRGITVGLKGLKQETPDAVIVASGIDRARLTDCMKRAQAAGEKNVTIHEDGVFSIEGGANEKSHLSFAIVDASTIVAQTGPTASRATLHDVLKHGAPLRKSPAFIELFTQLKLESTLWLVINGNSSVFEQAAAIGMKPKAVFGTVSLQKGLDAGLRIRLGTPQEAQSITQMAQGQLSVASGFFDKLEVAADGTDVVITAMMTETQLQNMVSMLGGMMGSP